MEDSIVLTLSDFHQSVYVAVTFNNHAYSGEEDLFL